MAKGEYLCPYTDPRYMDRVIEEFDQIADARREGYIAGLEKAMEIAEAEIVMPGEMPDELWERISVDRASAERVLRATAQVTKGSIHERIRAGLETARVS